MEVGSSVLAVLDGCEVDGWGIFTVPGYSGARFGGRLENEALHEVTVNRVAYDLDFNGTAMPHLVEVAVMSGTTPPSAPSVVWSGVVSPISTIAGWNEHEVVLPTPPTLHAGDSLLVMVEMLRNPESDAYNILAQCRDGTTPGVNWWSDQLAPPFTWDELGPAFGIWGDVTVRADVTAELVMSRPAHDLGSGLTVSDLPDEGLFETLVYPGPEQYRPLCSTMLHWKALRWTAPSSGWYTFHTLDSEIDDTVLVVLDDLGYQELACVDDPVPGVPGRAVVDRWVQQGETLTLMVGGDNALQGLVRLDILAQ